MPQIETVLRDLNPWWEGASVGPFRPRDLQDELHRYLPKRQILSLTGLRRVGKTTLLHTMVNDEIQRGLDPRRVLYFSFDELEDVELRELVAAYRTLTDEDPAAGRLLLVLDELQKLKAWQGQLKALYDRMPRMKALVSGSESLFIRKGAKESLAGRMYEFRVEPLSFGEYLRFVGIERKPAGLRGPALKKALGDYMRTQGFPELVGEDDRLVVRRYIRESVVEKVLYRDLSKIVGASDVPLLESLLNLLMGEPGQILDYSSLSRDLGANRRRVSSSLGYLERSFLVHKLYNHSGSRRKVERKLRKWYPSIVEPGLTYSHDPSARGRALEWLVVTRLKADRFWRDPYKNEVDAVVGDKVPLPVEVKAGRVHLGGVRAFMRAHGVKRGRVITWDDEGRHEVGEGVIDVVPAYRALLDPPAIP